MELFIVLYDLFVPRLHECPEEIADFAMDGIRFAETHNAHGSVTPPAFASYSMRAFASSARPEAMRYC